MIGQFVLHRPLGLSSASAPPATAPCLGLLAHTRGIGGTKADGFIDGVSDIVGHLASSAARSPGDNSEREPAVGGFVQLRLLSGQPLPKIPR